MWNIKGVIDFNYVLGKNANYFYSDGVHPNEAGRNIMAVAVWSKLTNSSNLDVEEEEDYYKNREPSLLDGCSANRRE